MNGIDVSGFQDPIDAAALKAAGFSFVYAKATEGVNYQEPTYATKRAQAKAAGLMFGAYHFVKWDQDAIVQADAFLAWAKPASGDLPPMLDCEWPPPATAAIGVAAMAAWLTEVARTVGAFPVIYMSPAFWSEQLASTTDFCGHPLWSAQYTASPLPDPFGTWLPKFHQYTDALTVSGVPGRVDGDRFLGTLDELQRMRIA